MIRRFFVALAVILGVVAPLPAFAATDPYGSTDGSTGGGLCGTEGASSSTICNTRTGSDPLTGTNGVLVKATNVVAFAAGVAAVLFMVFAGIKYITAQGDPSQISNAKQSIIYAAVGLVVVVFAREIINFVLSKL